MANRYLFRATYDLVFSSRWANCVEGRSRSGMRLVTRLEEFDAWTPGDVEAILRAGYAVSPLTLEDARRLTSQVRISTTCTFDRDQSDYLYSTAGLRDLTGPGLHKVRQYAGDIVRKHTIEAVTVDASTLQMAVACVRSWGTARSANAGKADLHECIEGLQLAADGYLDGLCVLIDGAPAAVIVYDMSIADVIVALFLKSNHLVRGLADHCLRLVCARHPGRRFLNTCQDLGLPGLRRKKLSLRPLELVHKYELSASR